ncbi:hypothetical protein T11_6103 [Trichinella zimbabwensis]|uniref:Uncharacterized protein n=1 Tax=Trichinella zimbabwensis TaxID=268475 RepID=A0A0V1GX31_9BILA|nr:hypothetical protein T11_6103 [Trichinella zimbabwensis]
MDGLGGHTTFKLMSEMLACWRVSNTPENKQLILTNYGKLSNKSSPPVIRSTPANAIHCHHKGLLKSTTQSVGPDSHAPYDNQINVDASRKRQKKRLAIIKQTLLTLQYLVS